MARFTDEEDLKRKMESGGSSRFPILRLSKAGSLTVRFLTEPTEWSYYDGWFDDGAQRTVILGEGEKPPRGKDSRRKFLANVLTEDGEVKAVEMPMSLADLIYGRWATGKAGTITDRDFELLRTGEGKNGTKYNFSTESPRRVNLSRYELIDLEDLIERMAEPDDDEDDEDEDERPARKPAARKAPAKKAAAARKSTTSKTTTATRRVRRPRR